MKFLIVDDHSLIREAMSGVLKDLRCDAQVLEAADGDSALQVLQAMPDIDMVLLDVHLPDNDGLQVLESIVARHQTVAVVMLSGDRDEELMRKAIDMGAQGFIPKAETREVLSSALALILAGGVYVPPAALRRKAPTDLPSHAGASLAANPSDSGASALGLTGRQLEVLALLMQGKNNKLICRSLHLAEPTVKNHVSAILRALGVSSRTEAVLAVSRLNLRLPQVE